MKNICYTLKNDVCSISMAVFCAAKRGSFFPKKEALDSTGERALASIGKRGSIGRDYRRIDDHFIPNLIRSSIYLICMWSANSALSQNWILDTVGILPEAVSNTAVVAASARDTPYIYAFGGLDQTKKFSGIHRRSYRFNCLSGAVDRIPDIPDERGRIAMAASEIDGIIYLIGGYYVYRNGAEKSSFKVHRYDTKSEHFISDAAPIPVPIDDQVQAVWRDSLIYVITGWSDKTNVPDVQIYDPGTDRWVTGTPVPDSHRYKSFGASGCILGDTIYYIGGAAIGRNFPIQKELRIGIIHPDNPRQIDWHILSPKYFKGLYRGACVALKKGVYWVGGSGRTYNYDGKAYKDGGGVLPLEKVYEMVPAHPEFLKETVLEGLPMDLRGAGLVRDSLVYLIGGMKENQRVSNMILRLRRQIGTAVEMPRKWTGKFRICPNPAKQFILLCGERQRRLPLEFRIMDTSGHRVMNGMIRAEETLDLGNLSAGMYYFICDHQRIPFSIVKD